MKQKLIPPFLSDKNWVSLYGGLESNKGRQYRERKLKSMEEEKEEEKPKGESLLSLCFGFWMETSVSLHALNGNEPLLKT